MIPTQRLGAAILCLVVVLAAVGTIGASSEKDPDVVVIKGHIGNLKVPFFQHPEVKRILRERHGIEADVKGMATTEMVCPEDPSQLDDVDFLFAGEQSQIAMYEKCQHRHDPYRNIFLSPMVIYSWTDTIEALEREGIARKDVSGAYFINMPKLLELLESGATWMDLGFPNRPNIVRVYPTNPELSSSGRTFAALLSNTMNCLQVVSSSTVDTVTPSIYAYYGSVGFLEQSSEALFRSYLTLGEGARAMVALIESQLAEYLITHPNEAALIRANVRMLYPEPTVWTSHPVIARTEAGGKMMQALLDPDLQRLGWEITGFRPALPGVDYDVTTLRVPGILPKIDSIIDSPGVDAMELITKSTTSDPGPGSPRRDCTNAVPDASPAAN